MKTSFEKKNKAEFEFSSVDNSWATLLPFHKASAVTLNWVHLTCQCESSLHSATATLLLSRSMKVVIKTVKDPKYFPKSKKVIEIRIKLD